MVITIPCYREPELIRTLDSLTRCSVPEVSTEIIIHANSPEQAEPDVMEHNKKTIEDFHYWKEKQVLPKLNFHLIHSPALPQKHAGVGLARKIAMDEAAYRLCISGHPEGIIVCLDADCNVNGNYLEEIHMHFRENPLSNGCSIYFEHPLDGEQFEPGIYKSIINYELFLRYYILSLKYCGFPYPYHTIGSCMAVRADAYMKQGGMNRRKAGEDFYFLHKLFPLGDFSVLNSTCVAPSPRISNRVPFGTGADIARQTATGADFYTSYNFQSFRDLRHFFQLIPQFYSGTNLNWEDRLSDAVKDFLKKEHFLQKLEEIHQHTSSEKAFTKRFFRWFDGFKVLKFVHFARDHFYPDSEITECVNNLTQANNLPSEKEKKKLLFQLRELERSARDQMPIRP